MRLKILFTALVILVGFFIYQKAPTGYFNELYSGFTPSREGIEEGARVEEDTARSDEAADSEDLANKELSALPKPPTTKPVEQKKEISTPGPLVSPTPAPPATPSPAPEPSPPTSVGLTSAGVITQTNIERQQNGVAALSLNSTLNASALTKANDMCGGQYFAHTSPSGVGAGRLAESFGYDYLAIGENLAYGPFVSNVAVLEAWMASPGHRANILSTKFIEMGAAALRCNFEGKNTWLVVQHFGKPASACPKPDAALLQNINDKKASLAEMRDRITSLREEIESSPDSPSYVDKVNSYNAMVGEYNGLIKETRALISQYNSQVATFNTCAAS